MNQLGSELNLGIRLFDEWGSLQKGPAKVEGRNFDIRKNQLEYDDVAND